MINQDTRSLLHNYVKNITHKSKELTIKDHPSNDEIILGNLACLLEECGEVSAELRKKLKMSFSKKKVENFTDEMLENELVDVLITWAILVKSLWIENLSEAIQRKIWINNKRGY